MLFSSVWQVRAEEFSWTKEHGRKFRRRKNVILTSDMSLQCGSCQWKARPGNAPEPWAPFFNNIFLDKGQELWHICTEPRVGNIHRYKKLSSPSTCTNVLKVGCNFFASFPQEFFLGLSSQLMSSWDLGRLLRNGGGGRCYNLKNDKEAGEVTEGKSSRMRRGR